MILNISEKYSIKLKNTLTIQRAISIPLYCEQYSISGSKKKIKPPGNDNQNYDKKPFVSGRYCNGKNKHLNPAAPGPAQHSGTLPERRTCCHDIVNKQDMAATQPSRLTHSKGVPEIPASGRAGQG